MRSTFSRGRGSRGIIPLLAALGALTIAGAALPAGPPPVAEYQVQDVGFRLPSGSEFAEFFPAINERGQVAGGHTFGAGPGQRFHAARTDGSLTFVQDLGAFAGDQSNAFGVTVNYWTQEAQVAGVALDGGGNPRAFRFTDSEIPPLRDLGTLGGPGARANKINQWGQVAGEAGDGYTTQAFLWDGFLEPLGFLNNGFESSAASLNDSAWVVGVSDVETPSMVHEAHAFLKRPGEAMIDLGTLENGDFSRAWDINNADPVQIVGESTRDGDSLPHAFRHVVTPFPSKIDLGTLPGDDGSIAYAVNDVGVVVGTSYQTEGFTPGRAFVWQDLNDNGASDAGEMRDLNDLIPDGTDWVLEAATDINNAGQIVGFGTYDGEPRVFRLSPPDSGAPRFSYCYAFPEQLSANGGDVTLCAAVADDVNVDHVNAVLTLPDSTVETVPLTRIGGTDLYCAVYSIPWNPGPDPLTYEVEFEAEDVFGNVATQPCDPITVFPNAPPQIPSCSIQPSIRKHPGGIFTITATVTDDTGVESVEATVTLPNMTTATVALARQGVTSTYTGTYNAPANSTGTDQVYHVDIQATDNFDEETGVSCGDFTVLANSPPVITNCQVIPDTLDANGGNVQFCADVTDDVAVSTVTGKVTLPDGSTQNVAMARQGVTNTFCGSFVAAPNSTDADQSYGLQIIATDGPGAETAVTCDPFLVLENAPPDVLSCSVSPPLLGPDGGTATVNAHIQDETGVDHVDVQVTAPGFSDSFSISLASGTPQDGNWSGTFDVPANFSGAILHYNFQLTAVDDRGASTSGSCGSVAVECRTTDNEAPKITACSATPRFLPNKGGSITVTATVTDNIGVTSVKARFTGAGNLLFNMNSLGGNQYQGVASIPGGSTAALYAITIEARDAADQLTTANCGSVRVAAAGEETPGRVVVTPRVVGFGRVQLNHSKTLAFTVKHVGGSTGSLLVFQVGGLRSPFEFVDGLGSFGSGPQYLTLGPGQTRTIRVRFRPRLLGTYIQDVLVLTNDPDQPSITVRCQGKGCRGG